MTEFSILNSRIGRYEIQERIGHGGMAQVFKAFDTNLERSVAVKLLHEHLSDDPSFKERFEREAKFVAGFNHPNIVQIYDFDSVERGGSRLYYMVMPYIPGNTLRDELADLSKQEMLMPHERVLQIALNLADALDYAHKRGMVHRDVKPSNILFDERNQAVLTDFGIARLVAASNLTQEGVTVGTPAYMAPEQATGETVDARADIYALGIILYEMLAGQPPFHDDGSVSVLLKHLNEPVPSLSKFTHFTNPALDALVFRALAKRPEDRYQTCQEFAEDMKHAFAGKPVQVATAVPASDAVRENSLTQFPQRVTQQLQAITRSPRGILVAGLVIIAVLLGIGLVMRLGIINQSPPVEDADSMTDSEVDSMVEGTEKHYFTSDFSADDPTRMFWSTGSDGLVTRAFIEGDGYNFVNNRISRAVTSIVETDYAYSDVTISLEATLQSDSNAASGYGIVFRYQDEDNYNVFAVDGMGRFSIWVRQDGQWRELRDLDGERWTPDEHILTIGESNKLTIDVSDNRLIGYVNGNPVVDVTDDTFSDGKIGIYLATTSDDNAQANLMVESYSVMDIAQSMTNSMTGSK